MAKIDHISYGGTNYEIVPAAGDLRDIVAPEFSDQNTYTTGQYVLKNGVLYRFTAAHSGAWTGTDAVEIQVTTELKEIEKSLDTLLAINLASLTTYTTGKYINYSTGEAANSSQYRATDYISIAGMQKITYSKLWRTASSGYQGIAFYDSNKVYISGIRSSLNAETFTQFLSTVDVPEGAEYIRLTATNGTDSTVYNYADYETKVYPRLEAAETRLTVDEAEIIRVDDYAKEISEDGYFNLPADKWSLGGWQSYASSDSRAYRVRYTQALEFDRDIYIMADYGYGIDGYKSNGNSLPGDYLTIRKIPANTKFKLYSRRFTENTSETISDITPFINAIKFSTAIAPIESYAPTFTDISMFERVGISGDSYAAGGGIISGVTALTWGKNLQRQAGVTVDIYAKSGDSIVDWVSNQTKGLPALLAGAECGLYWFQHGINGTGSAAAIGTPADMEADPKPNTFYGKYVEAIQAVQAAFPNARIVVATITGSSYGMSQSSQFKAANTAIKNIAEFCGVPLIDITEDVFFKSLFYADNIRNSHPTAMVAAGMAMANRRLLSKCIQDNPSYFVNYGAE